MLALAAYAHTISARRPETLQKEIAQLERELADPSMPERARAAVAKNIELKRTLAASLQDARGSRKALETELDSSYSVLEVLLQKSISMRDPAAISAELDSIVHQAEESERSVREMESLMRSSGVDFATETMDRLDAARSAASSQAAMPPSRIRQR
jgi:hypothetical protein